MKKFSFLLLLIAVFIITTHNTTNAQKKAYKEGEVIVKYKESVVDLESHKGKRALAATEKKTQTKKKDQVTDMNIILLESTTKNTEELIRELEDDPAVEYAEPNYKRSPAYVPNDSFFSQQWSHNNTGQTVGTPDADIDAVEAWDSEVIAPPIAVAVIDTGVRYTHEDLIGNMWDGRGCVNDLGTMITGGCPNHGWDFENSDNNPSDDHGHGTNVASIIAANTSNERGIAGMSRYNNIQIMALRFGLDSFTEVKAINFAKNNGANVINASYGGPSFSQSEKDAIDAFPGIFVAAAGNDDSDNDATPYFPCNITSPNLICVAASDHNDNLAIFTPPGASNYGATTVDLAAPGDYMRIAFSNTNTAYGYGSGTSFATPIVAGATAVLRSHNGTLTNAQMRDLLLDNVDTSASFTGTVASDGRLNFRDSLDALITDYGYKVAPRRTDGLPTNSLAPHTTSIQIGLSTHETATCRYSTTRNSEYDTMTNTFSSTGSMTHTSTVTGLQNGHTYNYYVRCADLQDNKNINDYVINFSVGSPSAPSPIYRFYSRKYQSHLYTDSESEKNNIIANWPTDIWEYQRIEFYGYDSSEIGVSPVYRFWSRKYRTLYYTTSSSERDDIINNWPNDTWEYQGIRLYTYKDPGADRTPVYRMWSSKYKASYFTTNANYRDCMIDKYPSHIWRYEGIGWQMPMEGFDDTPVTKC